MDDPPLASLSLTHVNYNPADRISFLCAWLALVPQGLCIVYTTLIWSTREIEILLMFSGQMACEGLNWVLKRWIKEERPRQMNGKGYGMPSSHAQFVTFFGVSLALFLLLRHVPSPSSHAYNHAHNPISFRDRPLLSLLGLCAAASVAYSRIYLNYHTPKQVLVGCGAGAGFAVVWFALTSYVRHVGWIDAFLDTQLARFFRMRDLVVTEDLLDAGWARWDEATKKRRTARNGTMTDQNGTAVKAKR